jgi:acyl-CoA dehydrogenase
MESTLLIWILAVAAGVWLLAYHRAPLIVWTLAAALAVVVCLPPWTGSIAAIVFGSAFVAVALLLNLPFLRRLLFTGPLLRIFRKQLPPISDTERAALEAGSVWWEAELFRGDPDWRKLLAVPPPQLSAAEQAFLDGPVETLCTMVDDWDITHVRRDLPPDAWDFMKRNGFFGMIVPKRYGGLEFSAQAHSAVVVKLASRSVSAAVTVMVPNSLGPAELLLRYGTAAQKDHYLPRLARGEEVPCFALTNPEAGSDAASIPDRGIVCRGTFEGRETLGIRLTWEKRYITLGPVATVLGLAFRLFDPHRLLGGDEDLGITLALIPTNTPGVRIGTRHNPLNIAFQNGPTWGRDVFVPLDAVIGGREQIGRGWQMLMDCLAAGRAISLPALSCGAGQLACRATGAYARIRKQFKLPIGKFEGVEEALARIGGYAYLMDAARSLTARAVDLGEQPAIASAIVKYQLTEHMRRVINDAMDVQGGSGICLGPKNFMGRVYQALPISITVEGANILTRTLILYGQGAVRCHPYLQRELAAAAEPDAVRAAKEFDAALTGHVGYVLTNAARALWLGLTGARFVRVPFAGATRRYAQHVTRLSSVFALLSDAALLTLGSALKRREKLSGRFADALSFLYLASAAIKRYEDDGRPPADAPLVRYACEYALHQAEKVLVVILKNFPNRFLGWVLGGLTFPAGRHFHPPADALGHAVAGVLLAPSDTRDRLTAGVFVPRDLRDALARIEDALPKVIAAEPLERRLQALVEQQPALHGDPDGLLAAARERAVLSAAEIETVRSAWTARAGVIAVDDFAKADF